MIFVLKEKVCKKAENYLKVTNGIISVEDYYDNSEYTKNKGAPKDALNVIREQLMLNAKPADVR